VVRHTGAAQATVVLNRRPDELGLEVTDDGPATRAPEAGNGILGMGERARAVGGQLGIEVAVPHGLRVRARLPIRNAS
jgi:signal transduction histidine kinase